jgi:hypothetical protein
MNDAWIEVAELKKRLTTFFDQQKPELSKFGSKVNQTFEAFVIAQVIGWYRSQTWLVEIKNPIDERTKKEVFRLKFSTRGRPGGYSYAICTSSDGGEVIQIRHQLRVATRSYKEGTKPRANMCLDVAIIKDLSIDHFSTLDHVPNSQLLSFGEAKHMSAFAELVASFVGIVHELQPERLKRCRVKKRTAQRHVAPFLYVSGKLWHTAEGICSTLIRRKYDLDVWTGTNALSHTLQLPKK